MTQQTSNEAFEKWYINSKYQLSKDNTRLYLYEAWQAATAESDKRSAELHATAQEYATQNAILMAKNENLEREITKLNAENKQIDAINASLQAHINVLREALERSSKSLEAIDFDWECEVVR